MCIQVLMAPKSDFTRRIMYSELIYVPIALAYGFLLAHSWDANTLNLILPGSLEEGLAGGECSTVFATLM